MLRLRGLAAATLSTNGKARLSASVIGPLIFGVLRNALAQIPGGTFAARFILGIAVLIIVVMNRAATQCGDGD